MRLIQRMPNFRSFNSDIRFVYVNGLSFVVTPVTDDRMRNLSCPSRSRPAGRTQGDEDKRERGR